MAGGGEPGHVGANLGDDLLGGGDADAGDLIKLGYLGCERGNHLIDPGRQRLNLGGERIDTVKQPCPSRHVTVRDKAESSAAKKGAPDRC